MIELNSINYSTPNNCPKKQAITKLKEDVINETILDTGNAIQLLRKLIKLWRQITLIFGEDIVDLCVRLEYAVISGPLPLPCQFDRISRVGMGLINEVKGLKFSPQRGGQ